ncbi:hypothetical protein SAY87_029259 [Trapa incisa]|uniref:Uncharacterized protein n=1 Tax=Trapa incisa TaxID=236973 RepID=A0AAN7KWC8_9MYRT|nr:hypothetical protein SAY87_029259 [Trapa incisa]
MEAKTAAVEKANLGAEATDGAAEEEEASHRRHRPTSDPVSSRKAVSFPTGSLVLLQLLPKGPRIPTPVGQYIEVPGEDKALAQRACFGIVAIRLDTEGRQLRVI